MSGVIAKAGDVRRHAIVAPFGMNKPDQLSLDTWESAGLSRGRVDICGRVDIWPNNHWVVCDEADLIKSQVNLITIAESVEDQLTRFPEGKFLQISFSRECWSAAAKALRELSSIQTTLEKATKSIARPVIVDSVPTMLNHWRCATNGCPLRAEQVCESAPTCYACGERMRMAL